MAQRRIYDQPGPDDFVRFKPDFGRRFVVTVDTEEEFDWTRPIDREQHTVDSVTRLARFQEFCEAQGVCPIYLVDYPIIESSAAVGILRDAVAAGARVWVVVAPGASNDREPIAGVTFVDAEWKAQLGILSQHEGGLAALWDRLSGNIFRPAGVAAEPDAEAVPGDCVVLDDEEEEVGSPSGIRSRWGAGRA